MKHVKPGKGGAFNQIELKELMGGTKKTERFRSSETVELAHIDKEEQLDFLYRDGGLLALMNPQTFEQIEVPVDMLSADHQRLLQEGMPVAVEKYQGRPLFARIPKDVTVQVTDTKTHVKGVSVNAGFKPATVTGGAMVKVPPYIAAGDNIVINTTDMSFVRRTSE
ncbi:elongation factor P, partial [Tribonema minus]